MRDAVGRLLRAAGYLTASFSSAEDFLAGPALGTAECLVLDVGLPGISGIELATHLAASGNAVPVVYITAQDNHAVRAAAEQQGAPRVLLKPFPRQTLLDAVAQATSEGGSRTL